ncbi:MAG: STAS domain-containing protein [Polyangiaceae bacterium]
MLNELTLSGALELSNIAELKRMLAEKLAVSAPLSIDLAAVSTMDTAVVQLLVAAKVEKSDLSLVNCPDGIVETFDRLGVMRLLL